MLLGSLPLGRSLEIGRGRWVHLSPETLEQWASAPGLQVPVLEEHDVSKLLGWATKVTFSRRQNKAYLFGELGGGPDVARVSRLIRAEVTDGLSPQIVTHPGQVWYRAVGRWGDGNVVELPPVERLPVAEASRRPLARLTPTAATLPRASGPGQPSRAMPSGIGRKLSAPNSKEASHGLVGLVDRRRASGRGRCPRVVGHEEATRTPDA